MIETSADSDWNVVVNLDNVNSSYSRQKEPGIDLKKKKMDLQLYVPLDFLKNLFASAEDFHLLHLISGLFCQAVNSCSSVSHLL